MAISIPQADSTSCPTAARNDPVPHPRSSRGRAPSGPSARASTPYSLGSRHDVRDLPAAQVRRDLEIEVEITLEQPAEVEAVEVVVQAAGEGPVVAVGQIKVVSGPQVGNAAQARAVRPQHGQTQVSQAAPGTRSPPQSGQASRLGPSKGILRFRFPPSGAMVS